MDEKFNMPRVGPKGETCVGVDIYHATSDSLFLECLNDPEYVFMFHKASEGTSLVDKKLKTRWCSMRASGKKLGVYHYFHPSIDPIAQARTFHKACEGLVTKGDFVWMDWEDTDHTSAKVDRLAALTFMREVDKLFGIKCGVYSHPYFLQDAGVDSQFADRMLWIAHYTPSAPLLPAPWHHWNFWQFNGTVLDKSYFNGNIHQLYNLALAVSHG